MTQARLKLIQAAAFLLLVCGLLVRIGGEIYGSWIMLAAFLLWAIARCWAWITNKRQS